MKKGEGILHDTVDHSMRTGNILVTLFGSVLALSLLWLQTIPLGIPGEWTWDRLRTEPDLGWNFGSGLVAAAIFLAFIRQGWLRQQRQGLGRPGRFECSAWLIGLVLMSFAWLWVVQEISPVRNRLGKSAFVLYYASSSGYFTRARYESTDVTEFLAGYEALMREGDVLHTGTHPPGLFLVFHGLIAVCERSSNLCSLLDCTQSASFCEALDVIAANGLRRQVPRPLLPLDRRVLWLATLLVMLSASLAVIPLYGLLRQTSSSSSAWIGATLWPTMPAIAIFTPKSDVVFPLIASMFLWTWLVAWRKQSLVLAACAGFIAWVGLFCSLAFLPVFLMAACMTIGSSGVLAIRTDRNDHLERIRSPSRVVLFSCRSGLCMIAVLMGIFGPVFCLWYFARMNLLLVWYCNYQNHAGFYLQFPRTWWKWLLVNPLELSFAAGLPVMLLAVMACSQTLRQRQKTGPKSLRMTLVVSIIGVWGLLWLTGKNSGEAARLWILFLPWLVWLAAIRFDEIAIGHSDLRLRERHLLLWFGIQFVVSLLTVVRVSGFPSDDGNLL